MNRLINRANQRVSFGGAATLLIVAALAGQILGFLRTKLVNANFDATLTDSYFAAFKIPDFFFFTLAAGALGVAFMPILADRLAQNDRKSVWDLSSSLLNFLAVIMAVVGVVIIVFAEPLLKHIVSPNLPAQQLNDAVMIMRLIAFNPLLFTISGVLTSVQQTFGRFFFYALAPLFYNASIILSVFLFRDSLGIVGLGLGALMGAVLQVLIAMMGLIGMNFSYRSLISWKNPDFKMILRQLPPRSIDQGIDSLNSIVETNFATKLGPRFLSYYENAYTLHTAPTLLIGTTISTAAFPRLTDRLAQGRPDLFRKDFLQILRTMIWITAPVVVVCYFARGYLARLIFSRDAPDIAVIFGFFAAAIFFRILYSIISRYFYAQKDTKTPLFVSLFAIGLNIFLAYMLSRLYGVSGLAMAQSLVATAEVIILFSIMLIRDHRLFDSYFWNGLLKIASVTGFSVVAAFTMLSIIPLNVSDRGFITLGGKLAGITAVTLAVHVTMSYIFGLEETRPIVSRLRNLVLKPVKIQ